MNNNNNDDDEDDDDKKKVNNRPNKRKGTLQGKIPKKKF